MRCEGPALQVQCRASGHGGLGGGGADLGVCTELPSVRPPDTQRMSAPRGLDCGTATAAVIPGSRLLMFPDMGHNLPEPRQDEMVAAIVRNTLRSSVGDGV